MSGLRLRYRISLAVIAIMLVCCMFLGSSYALWKVEFEQDSENVIKTGCFDVTLEDAADSKSINLEKAYPISDEQGLASTPYKFTVKNNCTIDAEYTLYLNVLKVDANSETDVNSKIAGQIPDENIMYTLKKESETNSTANKINTLTENKNETASFDLDGKTLSKSYILDGSSSKLSLKANSSVSYELRLWISKDATTSINYKRFEAQIATIAWAVNTPSEETPTD